METREAQALIDGAASLLALTVHADHRPGVITNLQLLATHAALVLAVDLPPEAEPALVFRPDAGDSG